MTTYNTGNPLGSVDVRDLYDNAENLDNLVNGPAVEYDDRLGVPRKSWAGMEADFAAFLIASGYEFIGDYDTDGPLLIERPNQVFTKDGEYWRSGPDLTLPYTTVNNWVTDAPKFVTVGDAVLRQSLGNSTDYELGATLVARAIPQIPTIAVLRAVAGRYDGDVCYVVGYQAAAPTVGGGLMRWDAASTAADDSGIVFAVAGVATGRWIRADQSRVTIEHFGAYEGQDVSPCSAAINNAINVRAGLPLYIPARRYKFNGENTAEFVCIIGDKPPVVASGLGGLVNGSILEGVALFRPLDGYFANFGVDHGATAFPSTAADALKISTAVANTGRSLRVENVVGLGREPDDLFHAILIEGYARVFVDNIIGVRNYYGLAIKCVRAVVDGVYTEANGLYGVIVKSDTASGSTADFQLNNLVCNGVAGVTNIALQVESDTAQISTLIVNNLTARNVDSIIRVAGLIIATDVILNNLQGTNLSGDAIRQTGLAYNLKLSNVNVSQCSARAAIFADVRHLAIDSFTAVAVAGGGSNFATDFISIAAPCVRTNLTGINLNTDYSSVAGGEGVISYLNARGQNVLADGYHAVAGAGAPVTQVVTVSTDPAGTTTRQTYKVRAIKATWAGSVARQFNLSNDNTPDGHSVRVENTTGQTLTVANAAGSSLTALATGRWGEFVKAGGNFIAVANGDI